MKLYHGSTHSKNQGISDFHCLSDSYLVEEIIREQQQN